MTYASISKDRTRSAWTHVSDIGRVFDDQLLTSVEYVVFENAMVSVVLELLRANAASELVLVKENEYGKIVSEEKMESLEVPQLIQAMLRETIVDADARLEHELCFVHPGFDSKLYLGSSVGFDRTKSVADVFGVSFEDGDVSSWLTGHAERRGDEPFRPWPRELPNAP